MSTLPAASPWAHRASIRVRYHECDMQKVVFNAHYLTYCDEAMASWLAAAFGWSGDDDGTTSFATRLLGTVAGRPVFEATITYVCVRPGTTDKMPVPADVRAVLGPAPSAAG